MDDLATRPGHRPRPHPTDPPSAAPPTHTTPIGGSRLKQRAIGEVRPAPSPPELTALLHQHIARFGTAADGRLFVGESSTDHLPVLTVTRSWARARTAVFGKHAQHSPVAARPYDLRHAAVSTWLNAGVPATQVAEWAGHSVEFLLNIYAKCVDGDADVEQSALGGPS